MSDKVLDPLAERMEKTFDRLWPLHRSLAGPGFVASLDVLGGIMPHERLLFPTGTQVLDWTVPSEWHPREAYFLAPDGRRCADIRENTLHLLGYSAPFRGRVSLAELREHLHTRPDLPEAVPYATSYYSPRWGFCIPHALLETLPEGDYEVVIDTELVPGHVTVAEAVLPGEGAEEILLSSYLCHPAMANNELSGPLVLSYLYEQVRRLPRRRYTYRFVLLPETIGSICLLSLRGEHLVRHLRAGLMLTCLGDAGAFTYKRSRRGGALVDRAAEAVLAARGPHRLLAFDPADGSDERQYCSPGFNLPVGTLSRSIYGQYREYHTSLDNKAFMDFGSMAQSVAVALEVLQALEANHAPVNLSPRGEPQLGKRNLYPTLSAETSLAQAQQAVMWLLNYGDGEHDLLEISRLSGLSPVLLGHMSEKLQAAGLVRADQARSNAKENPAC